MPNLIIRPEDQAAPNLKYDPGLARAAAELKDANEAKRRDWDEFDYRHMHGTIARRRAMKNKDFDSEFYIPGHDDPAIAMLRRAETDSAAFVEENLELHETNCAKAKQQQLPGQERWEEKYHRERMVNIMHPSRMRGSGSTSSREPAWWE
jgi:hypothetical protein